MRRHSEIRQDRQIGLTVRTDRRTEERTDGTKTTRLKGSYNNIEKTTAKVGLRHSVSFLLLNNIPSFTRKTAEDWISSTQ